MTWAKIDDQFHSHRKAKRAWRAHPRALGLHMLAVSYCAGHLTDGLVDDEFVEEKMPNAKERKQTTDALVKVGLWHREPDGWRIHDWLDYNPSRDVVLDRRRRDSERKARGRAAESNGNPDGVRPDKSRTPHGFQSASARPVPTRPELGTKAPSTRSSVMPFQRCGRAREAAVA